MAVHFRPYRGDDETQMIPLWNQCMVRDPITEEKFRRKILLDENFDPHGGIIAEFGKHIVGFCLAIRRRYPYYDIGTEEGTGWITMIFVHPEHRRKGMATELVRRSEAFLKTCGVSEVLVSPYTPNYFIPGVDLDAYADAHQLFQKLGYRKVQKVYSMGRSLLDFYPSDETNERCKKLEAQGVSIKICESRYTVGLLEFLRKNYPGDLFRLALERLRASSEYEEILIAVKDDEVVGFSHFDGDHFGPFAIAPSFGGIGVGTCLYYRTVLHMKEKGWRNLWLAWTTGHAKDFYHKMGLQVHRRHEIMRRVL
jgi:mycothiol synthase